jgi:hypothetical protein
LRDFEGPGRPLAVTRNVMAAASHPALAPGVERLLKSYPSVNAMLGILTIPLTFVNKASIVSWRACYGP